MEMKLHPTLLDLLKDEKIKALKDGDKFKKDILGVIISSAINAAMADHKNPSKTPVDSVVMSVIEKQIKSNEEVIQQIIGKNREETVENLKEENSILSKFLPKKMSEQELREEIIKIKSDNASMSIGDIMKHLKTNFSGQYDGSVASQIAKSL